MKALITLLVAGIAMPVWAQGADTPKPPAPLTRGITGIAPLRAPRGSTITLIGTLPPDSTFYIPIERPGAPSGRGYNCLQNPPPVETAIPSIITSATTTDNKTVTTFSALVPSALPIGEYPVCASYTDGTAARWLSLANIPTVRDSPTQTHPPHTKSRRPPSR